MNAGKAKKVVHAGRVPKTMIELRETEGGYIVPLLVVPGASCDRIYGEHDGRLKLAVAAPPEKGKANREVRKFLAEKLGVSRSDIQILSGRSSRQKEVLIERVSKSALDGIIA